MVEDTTCFGERSADHDGAAQVNEGSTQEIELSNQMLRITDSECTNKERGYYSASASYDSATTFPCVYDSRLFG